jgi:hypothetical protein
MINPLILPPSIVLPFSWPHHKYCSPSPDVVNKPYEVASIMPCGYLVTIPEARFSQFGNLPSPLISDVKLISVDTFNWMNLSYFDPCYVSTLFKEFLSQNHTRDPLTCSYLREMQSTYYIEKWLIAILLISHLLGIS